MRRHISLSILLCTLFVPSLHSETLNEAITKRIAALVAEKPDPSTQQLDPPASLAPEANLADLTAATDFASMALGFVGVGGDSGETSDTRSATVNAFTLCAGARGLNPKSPDETKCFKSLKRWFLTVGSKEATDDAPAARTYQVKHLAVDHRKFNDKQRSELSRLVGDASGVAVTLRIVGIVLRGEDVVRAFIAPRYRDFLAEKTTMALEDRERRVRGLRDRIDAEGNLTEVAGDEQTLADAEQRFWEDDANSILEQINSRYDDIEKLLTSAEKKAIDAVLESEAIDEFVRLRNKVTEFEAARLRGSQYSWAATLVDPQADDSSKTFSLEAIFTKGLSLRSNLTLNATYSRDEGQSGDDDTLKFAAQWRRRFGQASADRKPMFFDLTADTSKVKDEDRIYRAQAKATVPLVGGLEIPISITWANREDLVEESNVVGHIGISFDFANIANFFSRSAPEE